MGKKKGRHTSRRRKKPMLHQHRKSVMLIGLVLILLAVCLGVNAVNLHSKNENYKQQEAEIQAQIKEQEERAEEIEEFKEYVETDEYIKEVAEEKLGLVDPEEILFKPSN
ncbi:MAG: septum formation initiator family protein [Schaedlerella sp.]|nr:septum formation initiator family protein [Schaedlerella sp.]